MAGPALLTLEVHYGGVEVTAWDSEPILPVGKRIRTVVLLADDPGGGRLV